MPDRDSHRTTVRRLAGLLLLSLTASAPAPAADTASPAGTPHPDAAKPPAAPAVGTPAEAAPHAVSPPSMTPAQLDALVEASLAPSGVPLAALTNDVEFVRRVYLDVVGKLPTPEQTRAFVVTREPDKRAKLIDHLLASPDYGANWARYWRDVIRYRATSDGNRAHFPVLEEWLAAQLSANRPWDKVAHDLITATGKDEENGAVVFAESHETQPVELAGEVSRIFLGVQIQCAQCHDHPTDSWKRQQFHEFAAFFAGAKMRRVNPPKENPPVFRVAFEGKPQYKMPDLKDPQKQVPVAPKFFLGDAAELPAGLTAAERHERVADLITAADNPWFARAYVNRVWFTLMGDAFYTPVDDLGPERTAKAPEVLDALASHWQRGGYDVRGLYRTLLNTKTYQREVRSTFTAAGRTPFAANCPSRLPADQILNSLVQALRLPAGNNDGKAATAEAKAAAKDAAAAAGLKKNQGRGPNGVRNAFNALYGVDPSTPGDDLLGTIPQALMMMNGPQINKAIEARNGTVLGEILDATADNRVALNALYLRVLARDPTPKEVQVCGRHLDGVGVRREAFEDILWTLINSTEFITRR